MTRFHMCCLCVYSHGTVCIYPFEGVQILLESIGSQVDEVDSDWVGRLKGLLRLGAFTDRDPTTTDGLMGAPSGSFFSSADDSPSPFDFAKDSSESQKQQKQQQFRVNDDNQ